MKNKFEKFRAEFGGEADYKIVVQGVIPKNWEDRFAGMHIVTTETERLNQMSVLAGRIKDQAELNGVLESLYRWQFTIVSVERMKTGN